METARATIDYYPSTDDRTHIRARFMASLQDENMSIRQSYWKSNEYKVTSKDIVAFLKAHSSDSYIEDIYLDSQETAAGLFMAETIQNGLPTQAVEEVETNKAIKKFTRSYIRIKRYTDGSTDGYTDDGPVTILLITAATHDEDHQKIRDFYVEKLPVAKPIIKENTVPYKIFANSGDGVKTWSKALPSVNSVDEILANYNKSTVEIIRSLENFRPDTSGKIMLLSGEPGTGKTHLIMALMSLWKTWGNFNYISDPSALFGHSSTYLLDIMMRSLDTKLKPDEYNIYVLEDVGELLAADAKSVSGQGLGQLLNTSDGLIGQGVKAIFILTTNEEIGKLHPAVTRAGRCFLQHDIGYLSSEEANTWLKAHGSDKEVDKPTSLATLYATITESKFKAVPERQKAIGFTR